MRQDVEQLMHQTLHSMGVKTENVHIFLEWISDYDDDQRKTWMLRAAGMFAIGLTLGLVLGYLLP